MGINEIFYFLKKCKILVIGDLILDHYISGVVERISPEAPIQVLDMKEESFRLGGAANVAKNISSFIENVGLCGVIGKDDNGKYFKKTLLESNIIPSCILEDQSQPSRPTTIKTRFIANGNHLLRVDSEKKEPISKDISDKIASFVSHNINSYDSIIVSDYAKGVLSEELWKKIIQTAKNHDKKVFVGPKGKDWSKYKNACFLSANRSETQLATGLNLCNKEEISKAGQMLIEKLDLEAMLITLGADGIHLVTKETELNVLAEAKEVFDVAGAGDTVLAMASLAITAGASWKAAITLANVAAGIVVGKIGVATASFDEIEKKLASSKLLSMFQ